MRETPLALIDPFLNPNRVRHLTLAELVTCIKTRCCDYSLFEEEVIVEINNRLIAIEKKLND